MAHTGEQPVSALRSLRSDEATFVKFVNRTLRNARPWWINFDGIPQSYADIPPGGVLHMRTYRTHPWVFRDADTGDKLLIKNDEIYFPTSKQYDEDGPTYIPVDVTIPVYSLKNCCLQRIRKHMKSDDYTKLELPKSLHTDLKNSPDLLRAIENLSKVYRNN
ncbi:von Hippel-Lindau-like protein isoform X1 [Stegostoma tigrinum]|uniref:von Hippel-Lindau-like protein isoform X1 n=1 Tax=Stegostoma tigrinum TaxID=3053191 RepID=UPI00202B9B35|nr:von Hippel-Lindau-like protein isoform X1 [Stegostoma tigrinum]